MKEEKEKKKYMWEVVFILVNKVCFVQCAGKLLSHTVLETKFNQVGEREVDLPEPMLTFSPTTGTYLKLNQFIK